MSVVYTTKTNYYIHIFQPFYDLFGSTIWLGHKRFTGIEIVIQCFLNSSTTYYSYIYNKEDWDLFIYLFYYYYHYH